MRRAVLTLIAGLCASVAVAGSAPPALAQGGAAQVYRDPQNGLLVYVADLSFRQPGEVRIGYTGRVFWFLNPLNPLEPGFGCAFVSPNFFSGVLCQPPVGGMTVQLGPGPNDIKVLSSVPALPGPNLIQGNRKVDKVQGGQSDEQINAGKGNDNANPGNGKDKVNLGAGNDKADTRDGQPDVVNGGKGDDEAKVDGKDRVRNVEVVKRR